MAIESKNLIWRGINLAKLEPNDVVFFIRIRGKKSYFKRVYSEKLLSEFPPNCGFRTISEYKKDADFHIDLNAQEDFLSQELWSKYSTILDLGDVVERCRGLRSISFDKAVKLISRAIMYFDKFYQDNPDLKLIVMGTVDNYIMDIMEKLASFHSVECLAVTDSFMSPKYKLLSVRGEHNHARAVSDEEVEKCLTEVENKLEARTSKTLFSMVSFSLYCALSYYYRFVVRYCIKHKILGRLEYEYIFAPKLFHFRMSISQLIGILYLEPKIPSKGGKRLAYVPLHYVPEATIDYWVDNDFHRNYERSVFDVCKQLRDDGYDVLVKEHPAYQSARTSLFYRKLKNLGARCLSGRVPTREIFDAVDLVVTWNGSTAIEAVISGKPVRRVVNAYYGNDIPIYDKTEILAKPLSAKKILEKVLETSLRAEV